DKVLVMDDLHGAYTGEVVTSYVFEHNYNFLGMPDFKSPFTISIKSLQSLAHWTGQFPLFARLPDVIPRPILAALNPSVKSVFQWYDVSISNILSCPSCFNGI